MTRGSNEIQIYATIEKCQTEEKQERQGSASLPRRSLQTANDCVVKKTVNAVFRSLSSV